MTCECRNVGHFWQLAIVKHFGQITEIDYIVFLKILICNLAPSAQIAVSISTFGMPSIKLRDFE